MDRRKFLERVVAAASVTAASPLISGAVRGIGLEESSHGESLAGAANPKRPAVARITEAELSKGSSIRPNRRRHGFIGCGLITTPRLPQ